MTTEKSGYDAHDRDLLPVGSMIDRTMYVNESAFKQSIKDQKGKHCHKKIRIYSIANPGNKRHWSISNAKRNRIPDVKGILITTIMYYH